MRDRERPTKRAQGAAETRTEATAGKPRRKPNITTYKPGHSLPAAHTPETYSSMITAEAAAFPAAFFPGLDPAEAAERLEDPQVFRGLLLHLRQQIFAGQNWKSNLDYNDTGLLHYIFMQYVLLCARYSQIPTIENYSLMTAIPLQTINDWKNGNTRKNTATDNYNVFNQYAYNTITYNNSMVLDDNVEERQEEKKNDNILNHSDMCKIWLDICRSALADQAGRKNSIGSIFLLKSVYQYRDSAPVQVEISQAAPRESAAQIAARYSDQERPHLPGNGDNLTDNS